MNKPVLYAALACGALMAAPLWVGRFLPLLDLPQHLALSSVLLRHGDPAWGLDAYFVPQPGELTPYWTHFLALEWLGRLMPIETAGRVLVSACVFTLPFASISLCRAAGAPAAAGLLAAPLALNTNLYSGFIAYCGGVVLLLWALALLLRQMDAPRLGRGLLLATLAAVLFFTHAQAFAFLLLAGGIAFVMARGVTWRRRALLVLPLAAVAFVLFVPWLYLSTTPQPGRERYFAPLGEPRARYEARRERALGIPSAIAGAFQDRSDGWLLAAWAAATGALLARRDDRATAARRPPLLWALAGAALACYLLLPFSIQGQWNIAPRFAWLFALLLLPLARAAPRWLAPAALVLSVATAANAAVHNARFDREADGADRALAAIPPKSRVLGLMYDTRGQVLQRWPYLHFAQYAVVRGGGVAGHSFASNAPLPVRLLPVARVPAPSVWRADQFDVRKHGGWFDVFLVRDPSGTADPFAGRGDFAETLFAEGAWRVYRRVGAPAR